MRGWVQSSFKLLCDLWWKCATSADWKLIYQSCSRSRAARTLTCLLNWNHCLFQMLNCSKFIYFSHQLPCHNCGMVSYMISKYAVNAQLIFKMLTALFSQPLPLIKPCMSFMFIIYLLSTTCAHPCYNHTAQKRKLLEVCWRYCWVLGACNPRSIACKVWSCRFQLKLCISDKPVNCCM